MGSPTRLLLAPLLLAVAVACTAAGCTAGGSVERTADGTIRWSDVGQVAAGEFRSSPTAVAAGRYALSFTAENTACTHTVSFGPEGVDLGSPGSFEVTGGETLERPPETLDAGTYQVVVWSAGAHVPKCPWHAELLPR